MSDKVAVASPWQIAYRQTFQLARTPQFYWFLSHLASLTCLILHTVAATFRGPHSPAALKYYNYSISSTIVTYLIVVRQTYRARPVSLIFSQPLTLLKDDNVQYLLLATHGGAACHGVRAPAGEDGDFLATAASSVLCAKSADNGAAGCRGGVQQAQIRPVEVHAGFGDAVRCAHRPDALVAGGPASFEKHGVCSASDPHPLSGQDPAAKKVTPRSNHTGPHYVVCVTTPRTNTLRP
ncbi:hypothetical protein KL925_000079 [Ogataea polymorpha]|nr:hypothetical protein KL925_000079 [Ogataea polymorpha]